MKKYENIVSFLFEIGSLRKTIRAHQQPLLSFDLSDTIASHSFRVAIIGMLIAQELEANSDKVIKMSLLHDLEEARSADHNWIHKHYVKVYDEEITNDQFKALPNAEKMIKLIKEYEERKSLEAKITKDADLLDEIFLLREYAWQGNKEAEIWLKGKNGENEQQKRLFTAPAKQIAKETKKQIPSDWWKNIWSADRRK